MPSKSYKQIIIVFFLIQICLFYNNSQAQCTNRYLDSTTFSGVDSFSNVIYTTTAGGGIDTLSMDIYMPHGDTACLRHLIIWMHGGAFVSGTKNDGDMTLLCHRFAKRGYVSVSLNYRLASSIVALYDSVQIFKYAMYACSDLKAAIRYFYKDASQTNHWNIDTNSIFIGGSSAGGIAADFAATLDSINQIATVFHPVVDSMGGLDGNSGNAGYSSKFIAVASLAGAVNTADWIKPGDPPTVMCQGTGDGTIPYDCGQALHQYTFGLIPTIIDFCGSGSMAPAFNSAGVVNSLLPFPGSGHVPWDTNVVIMNRTDSAVAAFFYQVKCAQVAGTCNGSSGIADITTAPQLSIYPNPATDHIQVSVQSQTELSAVTLYDYTGRAVVEQTPTVKEITISVKGLSAGVYILRLDMKDATHLTRKVVIE
jgi:para-nitrobenzyl esterase